MLKELAQRALDVQDACNLSGVVHAWSQGITRLRELCPDLGTDEINRHPINVLFADKVADLTGARSLNSFLDAHEEVTRLAAG